MSNEKERWAEFRGWLKKVLPLNSTDSHYYCADVSQIITTCTWDPIRGEDLNGTLGILKFLMDNSLCSALVEDLSRSWTDTRIEQRRRWRDTVTVDTSIYKLDTTLPSMEELGLEILRELSNVDADLQPRLPKFSLLIQSNPFADFLRLRFEDAAESVLVEVFDPLGKRYFSQLTKRKDGDATLDLHYLEAGNYFLRCQSNGATLTKRILKR